MSEETINTLNLEEIAPARQKILSNVIGLIEDAELLLEHGRCPRAYSLAQLACEEMMKLPILISAGCDLKRGQPVHRSRLDKCLTDHKYKLKRLALFDGWFGGEPAGLDERQAALDLAAVGDLNELKNLGLYVTMTTDGFISPEEVVDEKLATALVKLARTRLRIVELLEKGEGGEPDAYLASPFHTSVAEQLVNKLAR